MGRVDRSDEAYIHFLLKIATSIGWILSPCVLLKGLRSREGRARLHLTTFEGYITSYKIDARGRAA